MGSPSIKSMTPERQVIQRKQWRDSERRKRLRDPEAMRIKSREYAKKYPDKVRSARMMCVFGITLEQYYEILDSQGGVCAICGVDNPQRKTAKFFCIDHDHKTGDVRGLLCDKCNVLLGRCNDNIEILSSAISYLQKYYVNI